MKDFDKVELLSILTNCIDIICEDIDFNSISYKKWVYYYMQYNKIKSFATKYNLVELDNNINNLGNALRKSNLIVNDIEKCSYNSIMRELEENLGTSKKFN